MRRRLKDSGANIDTNKLFVEDLTDNDTEVAEANNDAQTAISVGDTNPALQANR